MLARYSFRIDERQGSRFHRNRQIGMHVFFSDCTGNDAHRYIGRACAGNQQQAK